MDYRQARQRTDGVELCGLRNFSLDEILESGQCFRWRREGAVWAGVAHGRLLRAEQREDRLILYDITKEEFRRVWAGYFDLDRDYGAVKDILKRDGAMAEAMAFCPGMRVLRQDPWEALCSFILSQNNNIARIKGLVDRLCRHFGEEIPGGHAFPAPGRLAGRSLEALEPVRAGFRAKYVLDAARRAAGGEIDWNTLYEAPLEEARASLTRIHGVGPKVAECALLYGWGRIECFPVDVWIGRVLKEYYPQGFPEAFRPWAGLAQQYLFHYIRHLPGEKRRGA